MKFCKYLTALAAALLTAALAFSSCRSSDPVEKSGKVVANRLEGVEKTQYVMCVGKNAPDGQAIIASLNKIIKGTDLKALAEDYLRTDVRRLDDPAEKYDLSGAGMMIDVYTTVLEPYQFSGAYGNGVDGIERYRISSIEPNLLTDEVLEFCARSRAFMPHFHVPLQSGSDEVLRLMHRRYDTAFFEQKMLRIRELMPDAFIGVDVIVGMRGETDALFLETLDFLHRLPVSQYHVFSYSERPGTKALDIPHRVRPEEKHCRSQHVLKESDAHARAFYNKYIGSVRPVLLERGKRGVMNGFTDNYIKVELSNISCATDGARLDNTVVNVRLVGWNEKGDALIGELIMDN